MFCESFVAFLSNVTGGLHPDRDCQNSRDLTANVGKCSLIYESNLPLSRSGVEAKEQDYDELLWCRVRFESQEV